MTRSPIPYDPPVAEILRTARHVAGRAGATLPDELDDVLAEFGRLASNVIAPSDVAGDVIGCRLERDGSVAVAPELVKAHRAVVDGGWIEAMQSLGQVTATALMELYASANMALSLNPMLSQSAIELLRAVGTAEQRERYLAPMETGAWSGTMLLTEPDAGSDVGALRSKAVPRDDGTWAISGTKIFITWGEHDIAANIVHLVLARTPGSPGGTRGISLFVVPKVLPDGTRNAVRCIGLERKLGIHGSPTCVMELDGAIGELVGPEHAGMRAMFTMMNPARLAVGLEGVAIAERSWQQARDFARQRHQGRRDGRSVPIAEHPDVRRMLTDLRATTRATRVLALAAAAHAQVAHQADDPDVRAAAGRRVDLLTPLAKAWPTDQGVRLASVAVQVHGGVGFVEDTGVAQRYRDARIAPIYEGTNGIHAIDLAQRKIIHDGGAELERMLADLWPDGRAGELPAALADAGSALDLGVAAVRRAASWLLDVASTADDVLAGASDLLELVATVVAGGLLVDLAAAELDDELVLDARFFATRRVATAAAALPAITAGVASLAAL
jgi:alkylation response protein AidB-like acyl-CoA dehydrogenase